MAAGLLQAAMIAGSMVIILMLSAAYLSHQQKSATVAEAQQQLSRDAQGAGIVRLTSDGVLFAQSKSRHSVLVPEGTTPARGCRYSSWAWHGGTLEDSVMVSPGDANCESAPSAGSGQRLIEVTDTSSPVFTTTNAAGRSTWVKPATQAKGTDPDADRDPYFSTVEWKSKVPALVQVTFQLDPDKRGSASEGRSLLARTYLPAVHDVRVGTGHETAPTESVYFPDGLTLENPARSTSAGTVVAGKREGVHVSFTTAECGPYSTEYTVKAGAQSWTTTTYAKGSLSHDFTGVPNGTDTTVSVTASCPRNGASSPRSYEKTVQKAFHQSLPAPHLTLTASSATKHELAWGRVSSAATTFTVQASEDGGSWKTIATTSALHYTRTFPAGETYGRRFSYKVTANTSARTATSNAASVTVKWPALHPTYKQRVIQEGHFGGLKITNRVSTCPAGTSPQWRMLTWRNSHEKDHLTGWLIVGSGYTRGGSYLRQGDTGDSAAQVRCKIEHGPAAGKTSPTPPSKYTPNKNGWVKPSNGSDYLHVEKPTGVSASAPHSVPIGGSIPVAIHGICHGGTTTSYLTTASDGSLRSTSSHPVDYASAETWVTYKVTVTCRAKHLPDRKYGHAKASATSGYVNVYTPVPSAPSGVSAQYNSMPGKGGTANISFGSSANASKYEYGGRLQTGLTWTAWTDSVAYSSGTYPTAGYCSPGVFITGAQGRVRAGNGTGWSGWRTVSASRNASFRTCI